MSLKNSTNWMWTPEWNIKYDEAPMFVMFRKNIFIESNVEKAEVIISADSKYKLFVNGVFVEVGPAKGDSQIWYKDTVNIMKYLKNGKNTIAIEVLRFPYGNFNGNQSVITTLIPGLYMEGEIRTNSGNISLSADDSWKCKIDFSKMIKPETEGFSPLHIYEHVKPLKNMIGWKSSEYQDENWKTVSLYSKSQIRETLSPGNLEDRQIPFMRRKNGRFHKVMQTEGIDELSLDSCIKGCGKVVIPANSKVMIELHAGEVMTAYYHLQFESGKGAIVSILQSESYVQNSFSEDGMPYKEDRLDYVKGYLEGYKDIYEVLGSGDETNPEEYSPFWFRTFRFIQLSITTKDESLIIDDIFFEETGYPLEIKTRVNTSDSSLDDIWDISQRTLQRCMHETYEDCPFYEQLQYVMDSRAQILFTYNIAADDRLARQCMDDFRRSQRYDGLLCSAYPNRKPNVIPTFSIFYILMLFDHMLYFGDRELIENHMPSVERIIIAFKSHIGDNGLVENMGGRHGEAKFWSFVDWVPEWKGGGVPNAIERGCITIESLYFILGLKKASELAKYIGKTQLQKEYLALAERIRKAVRKNCIGEDGMIQDGPGVEDYSQHCQVIGVLADIFTIKNGRRALLKTIEEKDRYAQCTVSNMLYLFEAIEKMELYHKMDECWEPWRKMIRNHMTTCAEADSYARSDCHAWGAVALYELPAVILGVKPTAPGYSEVRIAPHADALAYAEGEVITPKGLIKVKWRKRNENIELEYSIPEGMQLQN